MKHLITVPPERISHALHKDDLRKVASSVHMYSPLSSPDDDAPISP